MHLEGTVERERQVFALRMLQAVLQEVHQGLAEVGVGAILDDEPRTVFGGEPAEVSKALLRHENLRIVFRMVHMAHVGHDATDGTPLRDRGRQEEPEGTVAGEIRRTADTVHHRRTTYKAAVHVPEDIRLEGSIHRDDTHTADEVGTVAHFLLAEHEMFFPIGRILHELALGTFRQSKRRTGSDAKLAVLQQREHCLLDDFGKQVDAPETLVVCHRAENRICDLAHAALVRHPLREVPVRFLVADKVEDAFADIARNVIGFDKRGYLIVAVILDDRDDLARIDLHELIACAITRTVYRKRPCMRGQFRKGVIVNTHAAVAQAGIEFQNNLLRHVEVADRVPARSRKAHAAIGQYRTHLDNRYRRGRHCTRAHEVAHLPEVGVDIADAPVVYSLAEARVALVGHAEFHCTRAGQCTIAAVAGRGARIERHLELFAGGVQLFGAGGNRERNRLRVTREREARNAKNITILNHCCGIFRGALLAFNPIHAINHQSLSKNPLLVQHKARQHVDNVRDNVRKVRRLHELRNPHGKRPAPLRVLEQVRSALECREIERVAQQKDNEEPHDFRPLAIMALEIPDAVHQVAVDGTKDETEKIGKFQVPVKQLVHHPDRRQGDERVHDANDIVLDEMLHMGEDRKMGIIYF